MNSLPPINTKVETEKIITFIRDTFKQTGKTKAIIAVSGGLDSATSLFLTAKAIDPKNVYALHLPAKNSNPQSTLDAKLVIQSAQIPDSNSLTINIGSIIQKAWRVQKLQQDLLSDKAGVAGIQEFVPGAGTRHLVAGRSRTQNSDPETTSRNRLRLANLAARIRMILLYDQAKKHDALVIGTENLSEHLLGYYTRFGDEASDLEPIRHLYKTQVVELAQYLGVPESIITKPPTADLWRGQTDQQELGFTYAQADPILYQITQKLPLESSPLVDAVTAQVKHNAFKHHVPYLIQN